MEVEIQINEKTRLVVRGQYIPAENTRLEKRDGKTYIRPGEPKVIIDSIICNNPDITALIKNGVNIKWLQDKIIKILNND